jgi:imidazolonepropionase-like amidohydrolase
MTALIDRFLARLRQELRSSIAIVMLFFSASSGTQPRQTLVFTHVTVIDGTGSQQKADQTVVIADSRILALGKTGSVSVPAGARVMEAREKFLIPGLWDMHVHTRGKFYDPSIPFFPLLIANGVTGVRDMGSPMEYVDQIRRWRKEPTEGGPVRPRIVAAGPILDDAGPYRLVPSLSRGGPAVNQIINVTNEAEARRAVRMLKRHGVNFVKVYNGLPRDAYLAIADEAKKQGLPFVGHVPESITVDEASDAGQKSMEHLIGMELACSRLEQKLMAERSAAKAKGDQAELARLNSIQTQMVLDTYSRQKARALFARLKKNHTWQCPTLVLLRLAAFGDDSRIVNSQRLRFIPSSILTQWTQIDYWRRRRTPEENATQTRLFQLDLEMVGAMQRAGVKLLAGTDMLKPSLLPGFSLHDELMLLVQAGLTPMEALQSATLNPARFLGVEKMLGTVQRGKKADLVLLDADPLANIRNTTKIHAVVLNGRLLDRAMLDQMLAAIETARR